MAVLEFSLEPTDIVRLSQWDGMRTGRSFPTAIAWHDTPDRALAAQGLCLAVAAKQCRLVRLHPSSVVQPPSPDAEARQPGLLGIDLPDGIAPQARFEGRRQVMRWTEADASVELRLIDGRVDAPAGRGPRPALCRLTLDGNDAEISSLAIALAQDFGLRVPLWGFAEQALAASLGERPPPRALGAPQVQDGQVVTDSLALIANHLTDVMLHWAEQIPSAREPEPVHQMRVATRRLRSALSIYRSVATCPDLVAVMVSLKTCAARLGHARDWDVFIGGLGARLAEAFPGDPRCTAMLRAASRRRRAAYADLRSFLAGPDFRALTVALACAAALRPWETSAPASGWQQDTSAFAASVLGKRMKHVRAAGRGIEALSIPALHELRKECKRLRYAAEFFASLFPAKRTRRFVQALAALQEELGLLNDSAAVSGLMAQLGRLERSYAGGLVEGFSAAHAGPARGRIEQAWKRFRETKLFW